MLIFALIDVQYLQNVVFSFEKGLNGLNYPSPGSHDPIKSPEQNFCFPPQGGREILTLPPSTRVFQIAVRGREQWGESGILLGDFFTGWWEPVEE